MLKCMHTKPPTATILHNLQSLWFSSGKETGKTISPYSTQVHNQLRMGPNDCVYPRTEHNARHNNTCTEAVAVDIQPKWVFIYKYKSLWVIGTKLDVSL